jgi:tetratricopeptide (TPR) repeat protein
LYNLKKMHKPTAILSVGIVFLLFSCSVTKRKEMNEHYFNLAVESDRSKDYAVAIKLYSKAIRYHKKDTTAYNARGTCKYHSGDLKGALKDYEKAIELNNKFHYAYSNRALIKFDQENYEGALNDFNKALELKPGFADALLGKGAVYHKKRDFRTAVECYTRVLNADSTDSYAYYNRGLSFFEWDKLNAACADWHKANQLGEADAKVLMRKHCSK